MSLLWLLIAFSSLNESYSIFNDDKDTTAHTEVFANIIKNYDALIREYENVIKNYHEIINNTNKNKIIDKTHTTNNPTIIIGTQTPISENKKVIKIRTWNVNSDTRLNPNLPQGKTIANAFPNLQPQIRAKKMCRLIRSMNKNEINIFFEVDNEMLKQLTFCCRENDVRFEVKQYDASHLSFCYMVMTKDYSLSYTIKHFSLTTANEKYKVEGDALSAYTTNVFDNYVGKTLIRITFYDYKLDVYVAHLGLSNKEKIIQTEKIDEIIYKNSIKNDNNRVVLMGDFNCFDEDGSGLLTEQINILKETLEWHTESFTNTITSYPYDVIYKLSANEKYEYDKLNSEEKIDEFKEFCNKMVKKYGSKVEIATDHVFSSKGMNLEIKQNSMYPASDHDLIECSVVVK